MIWFLSGLWTLVVAVVFVGGVAVFTQIGIDLFRGWRAARKDVRAEFRVYAEILPREFAKAVFDACLSPDDDALCGVYGEDAFGYETLGEAIRAAHEHGALLLQKIWGKHLFFVFCEGAQVLLDSFERLPFPVACLQEPFDFLEAKEEQQAGGYDPGQRDDLAVVFCKVRKVNAGEEGFWQEKQGVGGKEYRRVCDWTELQKLFEQVDGGRIHGGIPSGF